MMIRYRTLVMAMREFTENEWMELEKELHAAEITIENREDAVNKAYVLIIQYHTFENNINISI